MFLVFIDLQLDTFNCNSEGDIYLINDHQNSSVVPFPASRLFLLRFNYLSKSHVTTTVFSFDASHNLLSSSDGPARNIFISASVIILSFAFTFHDLIELYDFML